MISDREDHTVVLSQMKKRPPDISVNAIMTDDGTIARAIKHITRIEHSFYTDNVGWVAAKNAYGTNLKHLLCCTVNYIPTFKLHNNVNRVHRTWKKKLQEMVKERSVNKCIRISMF